MQRKALWLLLGLAIVAGTIPANAISFTTCFSSAPNVFGSPSFTGYVQNAITGLQNGCSAEGTPGTPTYYSSSNVFSSGQVIVTDYNSWDGTVDPGAPFGSEFGNRVYDGLYVDGQGQQFSLSELSFLETSSDPDDSLGFPGSFDATDSYTTARVGVIVSPIDGSLSFITSGPATQKVDRLVYVGIGNAFCSGTPDHCGGGPEQSIADISNYVADNSPFTVEVQYAISIPASDVNPIDPVFFSTPADFLVSDASMAESVPEPSSLLLFGTALVLTGVKLYRMHRARAKN